MECFSLIRIRFLLQTASKQLKELLLLGLGGLDIPALKRLQEIDWTPVMSSISSYEV